MEVRPGYKQTEVGVIPVDWEVKFIDQVGSVTSGKRLPLGNSLVKHSTPHPYIRVTDMRPGTVSLDEIQFVPESVFPAIKRYRIYCDDIFISVAGSLGIVGKVPKELDGANLTENADRITSITCSQDYLLYVLMSSLIQNTIDSIQTVGAQPKLALTRIRKFSIPIPPLPEQRAIATALSDVDALLGALERLIAKKRDLKQAAMQQLLTGKTRLPGFYGEWEVKRLAEVVDFTNGKPHESHIDPAGRYQLITLDSIGIDGKLKTDHRTLGFSDNSLMAGDIVTILSDIAHGNLLGLCDVIPESNRYVLNQRVGRLRVKPEANADPQFLRLQINRRQDHFKMRGQGTSQRHIYRRDFDQFELLFPLPEEQAAIAAVLNDMDAELAALEQRLAKTRALKQGMMQELLTGRTRLV